MAQGMVQGLRLRLRLRFGYGSSVEGFWDLRVSF